VVVAAVRDVVARAVHRGSSWWRVPRRGSLAFGADNREAAEDHSRFFQQERRGVGAGDE
jgi:hypothetical protein